MNDAAEFARVVSAVLTRFLMQNGRENVAPKEVEAMGARLWALLNERGWPRALKEGERGAPGGMSEDEVAPLVVRILAGADDELLANAVKQLVKACCYPEFTECRDSFRELAKDGGCRRQELARVRSRVSGTHCVDCPYWVALMPEAHGEFLAREWRVGGAAGFDERRAVFLPEDFRALRK